MFGFCGCGKWPLRKVLALFACFSSRLITNGSIYCFSVFYASISEEFQLDDFKTSAVFAVAGGALQLAGLIVPLVLSRVTERQAVISAGLLAGISIAVARFSTRFEIFLLFVGLINGLGQGVVYVVAPVMGSYLFKEKFHHISMSLLNSGDGFGMLIFPLFYDFLLRTYYWKDGLLLVSGVVLQLCICGALMPPSRNGREMSTKSLLHRNKALMHDVSFWLLSLSQFFHQMGFCIYVTFLFVHLDAQTSTSPAWLMTIFGLTSIAGRLSVAMLKNRPYLRRLYKTIVLTATTTTTVSSTAKPVETVPQP